MSTLKIIGKILKRKIRFATEIALVFLISAVLICIYCIPGVLIAAKFFGTTNEILFMGGWLWLSLSGLVLIIVKGIIKFCSEIKAEKRRNDWMKMAVVNCHRSHFSFNSKFIIINKTLIFLNVWLTLNF